MKRLLLMALLVVMALAAFAPPAGAAVTNVAVTDVDCAGPCASSPEVTVIRGTITCTAGQNFVHRVNVRQNGQTIAVGRASGTCTGSPQNWETNRIDTPGSFACGSGWSTQGSGANAGTKYKIPQQTFGPIC